MNLYTPAGGLLGTHVTWEDIEEDMQRELDTVASFGSNKTVKNIGDGNGFMSIIVLVNPDWQHCDKDLPEKFIVKIPSSLAIQRFATEHGEQMGFDTSFLNPEYLHNIEQLQKKIHNAEVTVYSHLMKIPIGKIPLMKIFYMKKFSEYNPVKGYIIMEYLENNEAIHMYENVPKEAIKEILRAKAVMEAMSLKFTQEEKETFTTKPFTGFFEQLIQKEAIDVMVESFRKFDGGRLADKADRMREAFPEPVDFIWADQMADELGMRPVLCHGDLWPMNILWKRKGDNITPAALIDFQTAYMGCPGYDFVRLFASCLSGKDRQENWENLLEIFYEYLKEEIMDLKIPYTIGQLKEAYLRFIPMGAFMVVPTIGTFFEILCKDSVEERRKKGMDIVVEKTECLLKDLFYYHERNAKIRKGEKTDD